MKAVQVLIMDALQVPCACAGGQPAVNPLLWSRYH
jgi:hypothetical protein